ncbi:hypothetical protein [Janthinobacterium sp.]|uniref:hypothetical protein n=1 Tax=Janthinobacterium sp. TaxID=1871054 RepID=UPI00293D90B2|nr:hypothetical protein [Janthinobacterium sp.]
MTIRFKTAALSASALCATLFCVWMFAPSHLLQLWGVSYSESVGIVARRSGALFAGLALMLFMASDVPASMARAGLCAGIALSCALLAALGMFEFAEGRVAAGIGAAVVVEIAMATVFARIWRTDRALLRRAGPRRV